MNNKILIVGVVVVLAIAGLLFVMSRSNTTAPTTVENTQTPKATQAAGENTQETTTVNATTNGFEPQNITVKAGGTIVWTNTSGGMSNVNSANHPTHLLWSFLNLGSFEDGSSVSVVFEEPGVYKYHNHLDASQTGTVTVE